MPLSLPTIKICPKHGEVIEELRYYFKTRIGNTSFRCKPCMNEQSKRFKQLNPDYHKSEDVKKKSAVAADGCCVPHPHAARYETTTTSPKPSLVCPLFELPPLKIAQLP